MAKFDISRYIQSRRRCGFGLQLVEKEMKYEEDWRADVKRASGDLRDALECTTMAFGTASRYAIRKALDSTRKALEFLEKADKEYKDPYPEACPACTAGVCSAHKPESETK